MLLISSPDHLLAMWRLVMITLQWLEHILLVKIQAYRTAITTLKLVDIPVYPSGPVLLCHISTCVPRTLVPRVYRKSVFNIIHNLAHPAMRATQKVISDKFIWHGLNKQVNQWARECLHCQAVQTHVRAPIQLY